MIIDTKPQHLVESSGELETTTFSIKQSAKAFVVLSSSLYKDKIRSIIRELSSNARDSHVAAGKQDVAFDVHLPTAMEPEFWIRDYGTGLSDDGIKTIYTRYFESTKETTNDAVGCLGLGSKSPFAYTQSFMVTTWFGGKKIIYSVFINDYSEPSIAKMLEVDSDEPNGLEVRFNVPSQDSDKFTQAARRVYTWFDLVKPNFVGRQINFSDYIDRSSTVSDVVVTRYKVGGSVAKCSVIMGEVEYPIDMTNPDIQKIEPITSTVSNMTNTYNTTISVRVPIGSVDFAPSREDLQYTKKTLDSLKKEFSSATKKIVSMLPELDEAKLIGKSYRDAYCFIDNHITETKKTIESLGIGGITKNILQKLYVRQKALQTHAIETELAKYQILSSTSRDSWFKCTDVILKDVTGDFIKDYISSNPTAVVVEILMRVPTSSSGRTMKLDEVAPAAKFFSELGYKVVLASSLLKVRLKDRKYHTLYLMSNKNTFARASQKTIDIELTKFDTPVYWVSMTNKQMDTIYNSTATDFINLGRAVGMRFNIVGIYEPSSIDVSGYKSFNESFVKDLDVWMASSPNRNAIMYARLNDSDQRNTYLYHTHSRIFSAVLKNLGFDENQIAPPRKNSLFVFKTSDINTRRIGIRGISDCNNKEHIVGYRVKYILTKEYFPITAYKDAHQFRCNVKHEHFVNFKENFANFCNMFNGISDHVQRERVTIEEATKLLASILKN